MTSLDAGADSRLHSDAWAWWQARRLRYNLALAVAGALAYAVGVVLNYSFGHPVWSDWRGAVGMTLFLGVIYLGVMGAANVCYLLGPALESWARPKDVAEYRRTTYAMGWTGSLMVPFTFPAVQLAMLIAHG